VRQALELRRVLEGERAQRSEAAREVKQLEKRAAAARSPALQLASPLPVKFQTSVVVLSLYFLQH